MDYIINDINDRLEMLENSVYQLKKDWLKMPFGQFIRYDLSNTFEITGANSFELGSISGVGSAEIYILCKVACASDVEIFVDIGNSLQGSKNINSSSQNSLQIFAIKTSDIGTLKFRIEKATASGSISEISVFASKNATFCGVLA